MTIIRWQPARVGGPLALGDDMDRMIDRYFSASPLAAMAPAGRVALPVDVEEDEQGYVFRADLPGVNPADVKVTLHGDTLTIRGERRREEANGGDSTRSFERVFGAFERSFVLASRVQADQVKAAYVHGVLEVRVLKAEEARPREIEVQVG